MFTEEQERVIRSHGHGLAVSAGAGCGKTTTLVGKCVSLIEKNPQSRFIAVSFTEKSALDIETKLSLALDLSPHWVSTIHGLCARVCREFPIESGLDGGEAVLDPVEAKNLWNECLKKLFTSVIPEKISASLREMIVNLSVDQVGFLVTRIKELRAFGVFNFIDPMSPLTIVSEYALHLYSKAKTRSSQMDFDDLEEGALLALGHKRVLKYFHQEFDLFIVDEFQDTNVVQAEIVKKISKPGCKNLCIVGDAKQSIYRFRDADVSVFNEFLENLPERVSLTKNFRSRPGIIALANVISRPLFEQSSMEYEELIAGRDATDRKSVLSFEMNDWTEFAKWVKSQLDRNEFKDTALLLRKVKGNEAIFDALKREGVGFSIGSGGLFWQDLRIKELVCFLKAIWEPTDILSQCSFLRTPWVGVLDSTLHDWIVSGESPIDFFKKTNHPIAHKILEIDPRLCTPGEALLKLLEVEKVEDELGVPLLALWNRCEELSIKGHRGFEVVRDFAEAIREGRKEKEIPAYSSQEKNLKVLTLHSSKGLEFEQVLMVDFGKKKRTEPSPSFYWDRHRGVYVPIKDDFGKKQELVEEEVWLENERLKSLAEVKRLFYVALTRAQEQLVVFIPKLDLEKTADSKKVEKDIFSIDYWREWILFGLSELDIATFPILVQSESQVQKMYESEKKTNVVLRSSQISKMKRSRHSVSEWLVLSKCEKQYLSQFIDRIPLAPKKVFDQKASDTGSLVHSCFRFGDWKKLRQGLSEDEYPDEVIEKWKSTYFDILKKYPYSLKEVPFEKVVGDAVLVGALDSVFWNDTHVLLLDLKVTSVSKTDQDLVSQYRSQLGLYFSVLEELVPDFLSKSADAAILRLDESCAKLIGLGFSQKKFEDFKNDALALSIKATHLIEQPINAVYSSHKGCSFCVNLDYCNVGKERISNG